MVDPEQVLDAATLGWTATVVRKRGHILNRPNGKARRLEGSHCGFAARAGPLHHDIDLPDAELAGLFGSDLGGALGSKRGAFPASLEAYTAARSKTKGIPLFVGNGNNCIVESRLDVRHAGTDIAANFLLALLRHRLSPLLEPQFCGPAFVYRTGEKPRNPLLFVLDAFFPGYRLARPLAGPGVGFGPLSTNRQTPAMPGSAIRTDLAQTGNVLLDLAAKRSLDREFTVKNPGDAADFIIGEVPGPSLGIHLGLFAKP